MSKQRSIWVSDKEWMEIKEAAAFSYRTLSRYLIHLHKMNITSLGLNLSGFDQKEEHDLNRAVFVDSEELDRNPDAYPVGTIGITDPDKAIKKPMVVTVPGGQEVSVEELKDPHLDTVKPTKEGLIVNIEEPVDEVLVRTQEPDLGPEVIPKTVEDLVEKVEALVTTPADEDIPHDAHFKQGEESLSVIPKTVEEVKEKIVEILKKKPGIDTGATGDFFAPYTKDHQTRKKKKK